MFAVIIWWSIFIEDLELYLISGPDSCLHINTLTVIFLLYADDKVLFTENIEGLQLQLHDLNSYFDRLGLKVNEQKQKNMVSAEETQCEKMKYRHIMTQF